MKFGAAGSTAKARQAADTDELSSVQNIHFVKHSAEDKANSGETCVRFVGRDAAGTAVYHLTEANK